MVFKKPTFHGKEPTVEILHPNHAYIERALSEAIASAGNFDGSRIEVVATAEGIYLKGFVSQQQDMEHCMQLARQTGHPIINQLQIRGN